MHDDKGIVGNSSILMYFFDVNMGKLSQRIQITLSVKISSFVLGKPNGVCQNSQADKII